MSVRQKSNNWNPALYIAIWTIGNIVILGVPNGVPEIFLLLWWSGEDAEHWLADLYS